MLTHFQKRAYRRFLKFGFKKGISGKTKIYNDEGNGIAFIFSFLVLIVVFIFNLKKGSDKGIFLVVWGIFCLGALIKFLLNRFLPQVILDETGVTFSNRKKVEWSRIDYVRMTGMSRKNSIIIKTDKGISELYFPKINHQKTKFLLRSYFQTYQS